MSETTPNIILFGFPKPPGGPSISGFCQKLETFLRFTSTPYELRDARPSDAPKGKLPYVEIRHSSNTTPEVLADSHFIIRHLIAQGISSDPDQLAELTTAQKAESRAWQAYIEEKLYPAVVYERWYIDENYATLVSQLFGNIPWPLRPAIAWYIRRAIMSSFWAVGIGRHSPEDVKFLQKEAVEALETRLEGRIYFHGDKKPSEIDLIVFAFLANNLGTKTNPHWAGLVLKSPNIVAFLKRLTKSIFPEYETLLHELETAEGTVEEGTS